LVGKEYTLDDLVNHTGFSKRQIRYYITEKLVPGAGNQRGPNAVYGEETLRRLEMIKVLKAQKMGPIGRTMTLAEIRHSLDNEPQSSGLVKAPESPNFNHRASIVCQDNHDYSASSYLDELAGEEPSFREPEWDSPKASMSHDIRQISAFSDVPVESSPLDETLQSLRSLLIELGSDTRFDKQDGERNSWRRITSPDVEIQVRTPDNLEARGRLNRMAAQLGRLLARED
jgi:DNA-binding transcriptional MerR regulator